jgi:hypothetical protein
MKKINNKMIAAVAGLFLLASTAVSAQDLAALKTGRKAQEVAVSPNNRVAVMPMIYIGDGSDERNEEMRFILQDIAVSYMSRSAAELKFMDGAELNAILYKNGIDEKTIREYTPAELAELLHVEYVIMGSVLQDKGSIVTTTNQRTTRRQIIDHRDRHDRYDRYDRYDRHRRHGNGVQVINRNHNTRSTVTRQNVETQVSISIYNDKGEKIYSKSRQSILSETDAYKNAIHYLLKRTPLYNR